VVRFSPTYCNSQEVLLPVRAGRHLICSNNEMAAGDGAVWWISIWIIGR
jgi:hypothetical protein